MGGESSYVGVGKPFVPDATRSHWAAPSDFIYACWGLAFKMDFLAISWYMLFELGIFSAVPYLICLILFVVPIFVIQSYLGQFSSSGFISAFRISPLFKGIGYISLALNFSILTYYSIFAAIPLMYLVHSMRPTLPWSCESFQEWSKSAPGGAFNRDLIDMCSNKTMLFPDATTNSSDEVKGNAFYNHRPYQIPSVVFFRSLFSKFDIFDDDDKMNFSISWQLVGFMLLVWSIVALIFYKLAYSEKMGKLIRYTMWLLMSLLLICLFRLIFLSSESPDYLFEFFIPLYPDLAMSIGSIPILAISAFGAGWGVIVSLASYNKFKTNIMRFSWFISLGQFVIMILFALLAYLIHRHINDITDGYSSSRREQHLFIYLYSGSALADLDLANLWSILFYSLLVLSALLVMITQLFALLTSIFDEFEHLRERKTEVTFGLIGLLALCSIYFCSNHGLTDFGALAADAMITQTALNMLLLLVVLWVYGRLRFQHDIEFMLGQKFATWRIYMLRFIAPIALFVTMIVGLALAFYEHLHGTLMVAIVAILLGFIQWILAPGFAIFNIFRTTGKMSMRLKRCCRPSDWYPADPLQRQCYENSLAKMNLKDELSEVGENGA